MPDRLKGKVAVVTGAAPRGEGVGNGMACAIMFAREGAKVVLALSAETGEARAGWFQPATRSANATPNCSAAFPPIIRAISSSGTPPPRSVAIASHALVVSCCG
jgi:NAD(P)-dependent dehydrogenase (short-subunit alcohol dehydrogenase family)